MKMSFLRPTIGAVLRLPTQCTVQSSRNIKRWVAPTLRELRRRSKLLGPQAEQPRSGFIEWNYRAELFAFGKRLHEEFQLPLLQAAFTQKAYIEKEQQRQKELDVEDDAINLNHNDSLSELGAKITADYVAGFLQYSLPKLPAVGQKAIADYLLSEDTLSHIALHLGMKELLLVAEYPPEKNALAKCLLAVVGALQESSGVQRAYGFVKDFVCTQLNQKDLMDLWQIENAEQMLKAECQQRKMSQPEARLLGDCGKNSVLAAYHVGIYVDKQLIGKGFGENVEIAVETASLDALQKMFGIEENKRPFDFNIQVEPKSAKLSQN